MTQLTGGVMEPKICIIGAGPCGITAAKNLLEQGLTHFTVFEKNNQLGGNWVFDEHNQHSSVYETTHLISSKFLSSYEDFGMPTGAPDYLSHRQTLAYFNDYARHFGVTGFIKYNTQVQQVTRVGEGQWLVVYQDEVGSHEELFDYLLVANGHHSDPVTPSYPGEFNGKRLHSHDYKKAAPYKGQRVLVVGGGNSACDVAVEISRVAEKTAISMRSGQHIFPKFILGKPTDIAFSKIAWMPTWFKQFFVGMLIRCLQGRYDKYQLKNPDTKPLAVHPTVNSELLYFIRHGKIIPEAGIDHFEGDSVYFVDGSKDEFDVIIFATGYKTTFPFFSPALIDFTALTEISLYRKMMHPVLDNLYFIGLFQPQGCIWPLADYQAKIAARIIAGSLKRPANLAEKIEKEAKKSRKSFKQSPRHALEVDYRTFRRQLLRELRAKVP